MITYEEYAQIRDSKGLKDVDVARRAGIQPSTFSEWKKGKCTPKFDKMSKIAEALGMYYAEFVDPVSGKPIKLDNPPFKDGFWEIPAKKPEEDTQETSDAMQLYQNYMKAPANIQAAVRALLGSDAQDP